MKQKTDLTLPEWAFLDAKNHTGDALKGRDVLLHIRSYTMLEIFSTDLTEVQLNKNVKVRSFTYTNIAGIEEKHLMAVHFSLSEYAELDAILDKAVKFYCDYLAWEDKNIINEHNSKIN